MSSRGSDELNLSSLPADLISKIIRMDNPQSLHNLRMISKRWNDLANEFLSDPINQKLLPAIKWFELVREPIYWKFSIRISKKSLHHFGVADWKWKETTSKGMRLERFIGNRDALWIANRLNELFQNCSNIEKLSLHSIETDQFMSVPLNVIVPELEISNLEYLNYKSAKMILDFILAHSVQNLFVSFGPGFSWNSTKSCFAWLFNKALSINKIYLTDLVSNVLLGGQFANWKVKIGALMNSLTDGWSFIVGAKNQNVNISLQRMD